MLYASKIFNFLILIVNIFYYNIDKNLLNYFLDFKKSFKKKKSLNYYLSFYKNLNYMILNKLILCNITKTYFKLLL